MASYIVTILYMKVKVKSLRRVRLSETPWTVTYQALRSMGFSRQENWSGLPLPSPGDLPHTLLRIYYIQHTVTLLHRYTVFYI